MSRVFCVRALGENRGELGAVGRPSGNVCNANIKPKGGTADYTKRRLILGDIPQICGRFNICPFSLPHIRQLSPDPSPSTDPAIEPGFCARIMLAIGLCVPPCVPLNSKTSEIHYPCSQ
jgi:hypothetical protein